LFGDVSTSSESDEILSAAQAAAVTTAAASHRCLLTARWYHFPTSRRAAAITSAVAYPTSGSGNRPCAASVDSYEMFAKQTLVSASLVLVAGSAHADPDATGRGTFAIGAGYATDEGFLATATIDQPDLFHSGNDLSLSSGISERQQLFVLRFVDAHLLGSDLSLSTELVSHEKKMPGFTRDAAGIHATATAPLGAHLHAFVGYRLEEVTVDKPPLGTLARGEVLPPDAAGLISAVRVGLEYSTLDAKLLPRTGTVAGASIDYADPRLGSELDMATLHAWAGTHQPLGPVTLHLEGSATLLSSPSAIPLSERLFLDGSSDVRGFAPGAFGPALGGTFELTGRGSLEVPLTSTFSLEGFVDHALIDTASGTSTGLGVIWRSPLGPFHVDLACPLPGMKPTLVLGFGGFF
jgi:outer membrane protein insertion porin family